MTTPSYIAAADGTKLAFYATPARVGRAGPGIVFLGGFMSDMTGQKATTLEAWAQHAGHAFLRLDYSGHGYSGGAFRDGTVGRSADDALTVIDHAGDCVAGFDGPLVLVGSSMGGWIMVRVALALQRAGGRRQAAGLVGIAAAADFTHELMPERLGPEVMAQIAEAGFYSTPSDYSDDPYLITRALIEDGSRQRILDKPINLDLPVRLIHGTADPDVPWTQSQKLMAALTSDDVELILVKDGDHRLSSERDLARLTTIVERLVESIARA
ncbi:MAG: alpha/beta fold hydrolase [Alphaproteobacteria bacterium]|nr:alpha/beta fold hydrolase [Alphaproteobacteria bacterium]